MGCTAMSGAYPARTSRTSSVEGGSDRLPSRCGASGIAEWQPCTLLGTETALTGIYAESGLRAWAVGPDLPARVRPEEVRPTPTDPRTAMTWVARR